MNKLKKDRITPYEFSRLCRDNRVYSNEFKLVFLDLLRRDVFRIIEDKIYINHNSINDLRYFESEVFCFLYEFKRLDNEERGFITTDDLLNIVKDNNKIINLMYRCDSSRIDKYKYENNKIIKILKIYYNNFALIYTNNMKEIIKRYSEEDIIKLDNLYFMASSFDSISEKDYPAYERDLWRHMSLHSKYSTGNLSGTKCTSYSKL